MPTPFEKSSAAPAAALLPGRGIYLRSIAPDDVTPTYVDWLNDPAVSRYLETRHRPQTLESVAAFVADCLARDDLRLFAICLSETRRHIGNIKVGPIKPNHALADVSLFIGERDCWGQGHASEAIALASGYAFRHMGVTKLSASFYAENVASIRAFEKAGFVAEGLRRDHYLLDGEPSDIVELGRCLKGE